MSVCIICATICRTVYVDISLNPVVQVTSVILLCANIIIYTHINKFMSKNWLDEKQDKTDEGM